MSPRSKEKPKTSKPGRPNRLEQGNAQEKILTAAKKLFMRLGYTSVSINDIVKASGTTKPTLYYYYPDKDTLYADVLGRITKECSRWYDNILEEHLDMEAALMAVTLGYFESCPTSVNFLMRDAQEHLAPEIANRVIFNYEQYMLKPFETLFQKAIDDEKLPVSLHPRTIASLFISQLDAFYQRLRFYQWQADLVLISDSMVVDYHAAAKELTHLFLYGLLATKNMKRLPV